MRAVARGYYRADRLTTGTAGGTGTGTGKLPRAVKAVASSNGSKATATRGQAAKARVGR
ncbi:MAG TPA: hypothetical protein VF653_15625 [Methylomirabilota bacterium]